MQLAEQIETAVQQNDDADLAADENAMSTLGWVLIAILVLVFLGVIGFSFNA